MTVRPRRSEATFLTLGLLAGLGAGMSCWRPADGHCGNLDGDLTCSERGGGRYCDACQADGDGCTDVMPADGCHFAGSPGTSTSGLESTSSEGSTNPVPADSSTASSSATTGPVGCASDEDCPDPATPFCAPSGACVACDGAPDPDAACAGLDPGLPYCDHGACVECIAAAPKACPSETPVCVEGVCVQCTYEMQEVCTATSMGCDGATNTCVTCTEHEQCAGGAACNLFTGECLPPAMVLHVGPGQPFPTLADALVSTEMEPAATIIVHEGIYDQALPIGGNGVERVVAFLAADDAYVLWMVRVNSPLAVGAGATVLIDGIDMAGGAVGAWMLPVDSGRLWFDRGQLSPTDLGVRVTGTNGELRLRNCTISTTSSIGVRVGSGAAAQVLYSTLVRTGTSNVAMDCPTAPYTVDIRNSIILSAGAASELSCVGATELDNAREAQVGELDPLWFVDLVNDDLHLSELGAETFAERGIWRSGDPPVDIDGDPRPAVDGAPDYPGADVPTP
jgi:hypothetical protein